MPFIAPCEGDRAAGTRAAVLREAGIAQGPGLFGAIQALAPSLGLELRLVNVQDAGEIERAMTALSAPLAWLIGVRDEGCGQQ